MTVFIARAKRTRSASSPKRSPRSPEPQQVLTRDIRPDAAEVISSLVAIKCPVSKTVSYDTVLVEALRRKLRNQPNQLISRILRHFSNKDTLSEVEYNILSAGFNTKFSGGNHGAVYSLHAHPNSWMSRHQTVYGSIVVEESNNLVRINSQWARALNSV